MKKNLMPPTVAPVERETSATASRDGSAIDAARGYKSMTPEQLAFFEKKYAELERMG